MATIQARILINQRAHPIEARLSTAAAVSCMGEVTAKKLGIPTNLAESPLTLRSMLGGKPFTTTQTATVTLLLGDYYQNVTFVITPGDLGTLVLGVPFFAQHQLQLDNGKKRCELTGSDGAKHTIPLIESELKVMLVPGVSIVDGSDA